MNDENLKACIEQVSDKVADRINQEKGDLAMCRLLDCQEYLARAWWALDGSGLREDNDTTIEAKRRQSVNS